MSSYHETSIRKRKVVLDSAAFIAGTGSLFGLAGIVDPETNTVLSQPRIAEQVTFYTVPDVVQEVRDTRSRARLAMLLDGEALQLRAPSSEALSFVSGFARATGDYASLSLTDLRVMALCYMLERERPGSDAFLVDTPPTPTHQLLHKITRVGRLLSFVELDRIEEEEQRNKRERLAASDGWETVPVKCNHSKCLLPKEKATPPAPASLGLLTCLSPPPRKPAINPFLSSATATEVDEGNDKTRQPSGVHIADKHEPSQSKSLKDKDKRKRRGHEKKVNNNQQPSSAVDAESTHDSDPFQETISSAIPVTPQTATPAPVLIEGETLQGDVHQLLGQPEVEDVTRANTSTFAEAVPFVHIAQVARPDIVKSLESPPTEHVTAAPETSDIAHGESEDTDHDDKVTRQEVDAVDTLIEAVHEDDDDNGEGWINEDNIEVHLAGGGGQEDMPLEDSERVGCVTTDFAMQNTMLQIGLKILTVDGRRAIKKIKQYALGCEACGMVTRELDRKFCEDCGNATFRRVAFKVNNSGVARAFSNPKKQPVVRGTKYSIPLPRGGRQSTDFILREDQMNPDKQRLMNKQLKKNVDVLDPATFYNAGAKFTSCTRSMVAGYGNRNPNEVRSSMRRKR